MARPPQTLDYDATVVPWIRNDGPSVKHATLFEVLSDSELVVNWILGRARVTGQYGQRVAQIQNLTQSLWQAGHLSMRLPWMDFYRHIYREWNDLAHAAAKHALEGKTDFHKEFPAMEKVATCPPRYLRGGYRCFWLGYLGSIRLFRVPLRRWLEVHCEPVRLFRRIGSTP